MAARDGEPVGRIGACVDRYHNDHHGEKTGFFGFYEVRDDPAAAAGLLEAAAAWIVGRGMEVMRGPGCFTSNHDWYGLQVGGKTFSQIVFFEKEVQFSQFKDGNYEFGAGVDAVAAQSEAGLNSGYKKGVAVFIDIKEGLMADASASGQKFTFVAK